MKYSKEKQKRNTKGITLIALVITIIVLLILAGVSLSMVLNQDGIFSRAEQATDKYGQAKARETLELALDDAQMQKYESGLTEEQLDDQIAKIDGELLPKEKPNKNLQNVIVDGYIFEIDRSVPKIVDYIGPADGVIITAYVTGNDGWVKPDEKVTVKGSIKKYGGGTVVSSSATATNNVTIPTDFPTKGGSFTIPDISVDTNITIKATDDEGNTETKTIEVKIKRDETAPTVETLNAESEGLKIKLSASGHDKNEEGQEESGIDYFTYTIISTQDTTLEGIPEKERTGTFKQGQTVEIKTTATGDREETTYIIKVTATDKVGNTTKNANAKKANVTTIDGITVAEAKKLVNKDTLQQYIGKRVWDYNPPIGGKWKVFYYDESGYFGSANTLYLRCHPLTIAKEFVYDNSVMDYDASPKGVELMNKMNPMWFNYPSTGKNVIDIPSERVSSYLCDPINWEDCLDKGALFALGNCGYEMYINAYNLFLPSGDEEKKIECSVSSELGYELAMVEKYPNCSKYYTGTNSLDEQWRKLFGDGNDVLASPSCAGDHCKGYGWGYGLGATNGDGYQLGTSPVAAIAEN